MQARILSLDIGDKRIGVAVSDPLGLTAQPLQIIERKGFKKDCEKIAHIVEEYGAEKMVIGLPLDLNHQEGPQAKKVRYFFEGLKEFLNQKGFQTTLELWDESLTSKEAEAILMEADLSRRKRKKVIDKLAAAVLLQSYLNQK